LLPKVNQMLFYQIASSDAEEAKIEYKSRIADIQNDCYHIEYPLNENTGRLKRLFLGDELSAFFLTEDGVKHYFDSHVLGFVEDAVRLVKIRIPEPDQITKVQRRNFLRVPAELEIAVKLEKHIRFVCRTDDVGGGGISFICDGKIGAKPGQELDCWLLVPYKNGTNEHVSFTGEIVRIVEMETGRKQLMVKFTSITDYERQKIIRYCFERQLDFRNR